VEGIEEEFEAVPVVDGASVRVELQGELDEMTVEAAWSTIEAAAAGATAALELDLGQLRFMSSVGLAMLIRCQTLVGPTDRVVLVDPPPIVLRLLTITETAQLFTIEQRTSPTDGD
jgi:anti-anti-sigma factor